ncbi:hypothetical protein KBA63_04175 [Candidatus Woesebacteria bacterium]|nr:hypothetical protein [Candidatus Woesebacteria bacterium]
MDETKQEFATFIHPPPFSRCTMEECFLTSIPYCKGQTFPVVRREKTTPQECVGGERIWIKRPCGHEDYFSVEYFSFSLR